MMINIKKYIFEYLLIIITIALTVSGFWNIFLGTDAKPSPYQTLHVIVNFSWLFLMLYQLSLIGSNQGAKHQRVGFSILFFGPLLVAHTVVLAIHSAHKGVVSGEGDFLIVQNVLYLLTSIHAVLVNVYSGIWRLHFIGYLSSLNFSALTITIISAEAVLLFVT